MTGVDSGPRQRIGLTRTGRNQTTSRIQGVDEKDWKLFRSKFPDRQENYMDKLNREYMEILSGEGKASDKFWALEERIRKDKRDAGVMVEDMSRSNMLEIIMELVREGAIGVEELGEFSEEVREIVGRWVR